MGRYNFAAQKVHQHATQLLKLGRIPAPPPWYDAIGSNPSSEILTRKPMQRHTGRARKASKLFKPVALGYAEQSLRWEFFNDHPWELARPRVVIESDGQNYGKWDWSHSFDRPWAALNDEAGKEKVDQWYKKQTEQAGRPLDGEAVVQRQNWLMKNAGLSEAAAYDMARKEFYRARHAQEVEARVAREEATFYGGSFGMSALEVGMKLEDGAYDNWRDWAIQQVIANKQASNTQSGSMDTVNEDDNVVQQEAEEVSDQLPASRAGQAARGGAAVHP